MHSEDHATSPSTIRKAESFDDRHVLAKHQIIYPAEETLNAVQEIVTRVEKALKLVSDKMFEEDRAQAKADAGAKAEAGEGSAPVDTKEEDDAAKYREVKGVMRIGILAKGLMLKDDREVSLAVLCQNWPTKPLLARMFKLLPACMKEIAPDDEYAFSIQMEHGQVTVKSSSKELPILLKILLTSPVCRVDPNKEQEGEAEKETAKEVEDKNNLSKEHCLSVLAELRHQKWFEARASGLASCVIVVRVIYDLINRVSSWRSMPRWAAELLVEKALSCSPASFLSPGDALRRVIETIASGIFLPDGCGLMDPCEREKVDAAAALSLQEREDLTASAQHALRLITFKNIHKVLGIEPLGNLDRKRTAEEASKTGIAAKQTKTQ